MGAMIKTVVTFFPSCFFSYIIIIESNNKKNVHFNNLNHVTWSLFSIKGKYVYILNWSVLMERIVYVMITVGWILTFLGWKNALDNTEYYGNVWSKQRNIVADTPSTLHESIGMECRSLNQRTKNVHYRSNSPHKMVCALLLFIRDVVVTHMALNRYLLLRVEYGCWCRFR